MARLCFKGIVAHRKVGYPRFKAATQYNSFTYPQYGNGVSVLDNGLLRLAKIGDIAVAWSRPMVGEVKTVTLVRNADIWYVCCSCANVPVEPHPATGQTVGIDLGLKAFLVTDQRRRLRIPAIIGKHRSASRNANKKSRDDPSSQNVRLMPRQARG